MKYQNIFFPEGTIQQAIEIITEIPDRLLQYGTKNTKKEKPDKYQYNRNIDRLVRYWNAIAVNRNLQTYQDNNRLMTWGIQIREKKYAFIFEKNSQENSLSNNSSYKRKTSIKNPPAWSLKQIGTERTIDFTNINVLDLTKDIKRRAYDATYKFEFGEEFKNIPVNANRIISKLTAINKRDSLSFEYNRLDKTDNMTEKPDLAFGYYGKKSDDCYEQIVFTEADDVNKVYKIQKMMKGKDKEKALSFFSQYAFMLNNKEIEKRLWWVFTNKKPVFKQIGDDDKLYELTENMKSFLEKYVQQPISNYQSLVVGADVYPLCPTYPYIQHKAKHEVEEEKFDNIFEQELIAICHEKKIYECSGSKVIPSKIAVEAGETDNGKYYYAAFTSKEDVQCIDTVNKLFVAKTVKTAIAGLFDQLKVEDYIKKSSHERLYVIKCCVANTVEEDAFDDDGLSTATGTIINGGEVTMILDQRIIVNK